MNLNQGETWTDRFGLTHPITEMSVNHRVYSARLLENHASSLAWRYLHANPLPDPETTGDMAYDWLSREFDDIMHDPRAWVRRSKLYQALMDLPEPDVDPTAPEFDNPVVILEEQV